MQKFFTLELSKRREKRVKNVCNLFDVHFNQCNANYFLLSSFVFIFKAFYFSQVIHILVDLCRIRQLSLSYYIKTQTQERDEHSNNF
jgi:hypothetical protein